MRYDWLWLYAAVEPATGHCVCLSLPALNHESFQCFIDHLQSLYPEDLVILVQDNARAHCSAKGRWAKQMAPLYLPPYSPQLYPVERWFEGLRGALSNRVFETRAALETALSDVLQAFRNAPDRLARLTGFGWWLQALET